MRLGRPAMTCSIKLNGWSCDCRPFQALRLPYLHAIETYVFYKLNYDDFANKIIKKYTNNKSS